MTHAVIFNNGECFASIAVAGDALYERNVARTAEFIHPIIVPDELSVGDVLGELNSGRKRILKTGVDVDVVIDGETRSIEHKKLSKR